MAEGRLDSEETPTQIGTLQSDCVLSAPCRFCGIFLHRISAPPCARHSVAFDDFLQGPQHNRLAGCSCGKAGRSCGTKTMSGSGSRIKIGKFLGSPMRFPAQGLAKADPPAASLACEWLEGKIVQGILLRMKK